MLFNVVFADSMHEFFSKLPLGSIRKFDYFAEKKKWKAIISLSPSLIIGLYIMIHWALYKLSPEHLDFCVKWILPATIILTSIASLVLVISIILDGGLWGIIVKIPLLFTTNLCFSAILGPILVFGGVLAIIIIIPIVILIIIGIFSPRYIIIHRD